MPGKMAGKPRYNGVEEISWDNVPKTFQAYRDGYYAHTEAKRPEDVPGTFADAPDAMREWIGGKALLYDDTAETFGDAYSLWVVNPETDKLNAPGLRNALARASQVSDVSTEERDKAVEIGRSLLSEEFKDEDTDESADISPENESQSVEADVMAQVRTHLEAAMKLLNMGDDDQGGSEDDPEPYPYEEGEQAEAFSESAASIVSIVEQDTPTDRRAPLSLDVALIRVGPGNKKDNHWYTREMLERDGAIFEGLTMHTVDHREDQRAETTDVSTVKQVTGITEIDGEEYLVARVLAYDPDFCEKTRNRADAGLLSQLQCSILAMGKATPQEIDGQTFNVVQEITEARHVDWVTRAGAGGHALQLSEAEPENTESEEEENEVSEADGGDTTTVVLSEDDEEEVTEDAPTLEALDVIKVIEANAPHLAATSVASLLAGAYLTENEVKAALNTEIARLKENGSGAPIAMGNPRFERRHVSREEINESLDEVNDKWLGGK